MRINLDQIEFYQAFLEELALKFEFAILCSDLKRPDIAIVAEFVKWVRDDIVRDARCERNGGSFLSQHALAKWKKLRGQVIMDGQEALEYDPPPWAVARYLADEANPEEQALVIPLLKHAWFQKLVKEVKEVFGARSEDERDQQAKLRVHEA